MNLSLSWARSVPKRLVLSFWLRLDKMPWREESSMSCRPFWIFKLNRPPEEKPQNTNGRPFCPLSVGMKILSSELKNQLKFELDLMKHWWRRPLKLNVYGPKFESPNLFRTLAKKFGAKNTENFWHREGRSEGENFCFRGQNAPPQKSLMWQMWRNGCEDRPSCENVKNETYENVKCETCFRDNCGQKRDKIRALPKIWETLGGQERQLCHNIFDRSFLLS